MSLHGAPRHLELAGNLGVVAALQKQLHNLLLAGPEPNCLIPHQVRIPFHRHPLQPWLRLYFQLT
jgi:hypothetical protein